MNDERFFELITKFLSKEITEVEKNELSIILQIDQYKKQFETIAANWKNEKRDDLKYDADEGLANLTQKLTERDSSFHWGDNIKPRKSFIRNPVLLKIAASIIFIIVIAGGALYMGGYLTSKNVDIAWSEKITIPGQKLIFELSDHSVITMNADGKIKYPAKFGGDSRDIYLEGEAYFEVYHDSGKPFVVHTGNISTTVLGTKFNVKAFPGENEITVSLIEGKVKVSGNETNGTKGSVMLDAKQKLVFDINTEMNKIEDFDYQKEIGWKDNNLKFEKEPLEKIFVVLGRAYGVKFELSDKSYGEKRITANFNKVSLWTVVESIKKLTDLKYDAVKENNVVKKFIFYKKK